jgi:hypothetical protein
MSLIASTSLLSSSTSALKTSSPGDPVAGYGFVWDGVADSDGRKRSLWLCCRASLCSVDNGWSGGTG